MLEAAGEDTAAVHFKDARGRLCAIREGVRTSSELSPVSIVAHAPEWAWMWVYVSGTRVFYSVQRTVVVLLLSQVIRTPQRLS